MFAAAKAPVPMDPNLDITRHIRGIDIRQYTFLKPQSGKEVIDLFDGLGKSPKATIMSIRALTLMPGSVIGFHRHMHKEKIYQKESHVGEIIVVMIIDGKPASYELEYESDGLIIPRAVPHGMIVNHVGTSPARIRVTASLKDIDDIEWQAGYDELIKNKHKTGRTFIDIPENK